MPEDDMQLLTGHHCLFLRSPEDEHCTKHTNHSSDSHLSPMTPYCR